MSNLTSVEWNLYDRIKAACSGNQFAGVRNTPDGVIVDVTTKGDREQESFLLTEENVLAFETAAAKRKQEWDEYKESVKALPALPAGTPTW